MQKVFRYLFFIDIVVLVLWVYIYQTIIKVLNSVGTYGSVNMLTINSMIVAFCAVFLFLFAALGFSKDLQPYQRLNLAAISLIIGVFLFFVSQLQKEVWGLGGRSTETALFAICIASGVTSLFKDKLNIPRKVMAAFGLLFSLAWLFYGFYRVF